MSPTSGTVLGTDYPEKVTSQTTRTSENLVRIQKRIEFYRARVPGQIRITIR